MKRKYLQVLGLIGAMTIAGAAVTACSSEDDSSSTDSSYSSDSDDSDTDCRMRYAWKRRKQ